MSPSASVRQAVLALPIFLFAILPVKAADLAVPYLQGPSSGQPPWMTIWTGFGLSDHFFGGYVGGVWSPQRNIWAEGMLFRADAALGQYIYDNPPGFNKNSVSTDSADLLIGYRKAAGAGWITGYIGVNYEAHHNPDPAATVNGTRAGVKGLVEYFGPLGDKLNFLALGSYSTAFEHYYTLARLTYKLVDKLEVGPEVSALGSIGYRQWRIGSAARVQTGFGEIVVSGGYFQNTQNALTSDKDGFYANIHLGFLLR